MSQSLDSVLSAVAEAAQAMSAGNRARALEILNEILKAAIEDGGGGDASTSPWEGRSARPMRLPPIERAALDRAMGVASRERASFVRRDRNRLIFSVG